ALLCWLAFRNIYNSYFILLGIGIYTIYAVYKFFDENGVWDWITKYNAENIAGSMKATQPWIEETREFFGLVILITVLLIDYFYSKKMISRKRF
ncbi:MAG: transmembrane 220 family protein, partial [Bacteroidota bacterium]